MLTRRLALAGLRAALRLLCRVDAADVRRVPPNGPLLLAANHVNFLDVPLFYTQFAPRPLSVLVKAQTWDNPTLGWLFDTLGGADAIPVRRGEMDRAGLRRALAALASGRILAVAPEGHRSAHGQLQHGWPGVVMLALHAGAPIWPVVTFGGECFWPNLKRLRRTDITIRVGDPFYLDAGDRRVTREVRQQMTEEIMCQLAALLPAANRGVYANLGAATETFLRFPDGATSNLRAARI